jgi:hypothetical protein
VHAVRSKQPLALFFHIPHNHNAYKNANTKPTAPPTTQKEFAASLNKAKELKGDADAELEKDMDAAPIEVHICVIAPMFMFMLML